ncbi:MULTISPECIES: sensor domain-containing diguanylate cyclase [Gammaproteobacteria]|uniref:sensor domain-containing diguanylate cyclase n=1 Tax=Gammaproteobacteria TaxID=1236 RepID=UPI001913F6AE|nr:MULTISPECIES: sensor domain-containing diguanylate cyclase [Gammaproteobacteria]MBK5302010.1 sensor domain-containing diguanylate cyclase [Bacillus sp. TH86]MBK5321779.1 sensor domain-containing diguanylate cyclase [Bacillus sp. TH59]MBK5336729.1 sensor domain-containing diguanylate cyclase [Bacillus sp. TH57]MBK5310792.1 sensor domain-containing diguanylate cyclase [Pseudomonas sp. TH71]MBK5316276.1 sensor domain-containing diguanylate cyclase [Erwinia sp. TH79]
MGHPFVKDRTESTRLATPWVAGQVESKLKVRYAVSLLVAVCLSMTAIVIGEGWNSRQYHLHGSEVEMSNLAQTLASQAQASIKQADTLLFALVDRLENDGMEPAKIPRLQTLLHAQRSELAQIHGLFVYDEDGRWLANSNNAVLPNANNADREYFIYHRDHPDRGPHIGPSIKSRSTGEWIMTVSRRINHADGRFAGVALATIYLNHFLDLYNSIDMGSNGVVNLIANDATIVVRRPFNEADIGTSVAKGPLFTQLLPKGDSGTAIVKSYVDGVERVVGFRRVEGYPLVVFAALEKDEVLASWKQESVLSASLVLLLLGFLGVLGYRLIRVMKQQNHIQTELLEAQEKLIEVNHSLKLLALEDALTGLSNRRQFDLFILAEMGRARRTHTSLALLMIDVDHFKSFNDHYGHLAGDECLRKISTIITDNIQRPGDLAARFGGEEFTVVLPGTDYVGAFLVAEKIRRAVQQTDIKHSGSPEGLVTVSIGVCAYNQTAQNQPEDLIGAADKALYVAKASGRNMSVIAN